MAFGYLIITTKCGPKFDAYKVCEDLQKIKGISDIHILSGEDGILAKIEAENFNVLGKIVVDEVRHIPGVEDTKTLVGLVFDD